MQTIVATEGPLFSLQFLELQAQAAQPPQACKNPIAKAATLCLHLFDKNRIFGKANVTWNFEGRHNIPGVARVAPLSTLHIKSRVFCPVGLCPFFYCCHSLFSEILFPGGVRAILKP